MSVAYLNLTGQKIGKLTVLELSDIKDGKTNRKWKCQCECGNFIYYTARVLNEAKKTGRNINCGCSTKREYIGQQFGDYIVTSFNQSKNYKRFKLYNCNCLYCNDSVILSTNQLMKGKQCPICRSKKYKIIKKIRHVLSSMKKRCYNEKDKSFVNYGARGIRVCEEWLGNSDKFVEWALKNGYEEGLSIDRIDNNDNYCPENCRWVDRKTQANNTRVNHFITFENQTLTLKQWSEKINISYSCLLSRLKHNWSIEKALLTPVKK